MKIGLCPSKVTDEELLGAFMPTSTACELVADYGSASKALCNILPEELARLKGVGPVKARQLQYVCELTKRLYRSSTELPPVIRSPQDVYARVASLQNLAVEQFWAVYLNTKNGVLAERAIFQGTVNATVVAPREIFHRAIRLMAASVILVHNHPSGDPTPSSEDITITKKMVEAGKVVDIAVLDHVIIGKGQFLSLKEKGIL